MPFEFLSCILDLTTFELRRHGRVIKVEPKVFDVLVHLIERRDRVVTKIELLDSLWPGEAVSDSVLPRCIAAARRAIGDTRAKQRGIQTVHGRGYRLVAALEDSVELPGAPQSQSLDTPPRPTEHGQTFGEDSKFVGFAILGPNGTIDPDGVMLVVSYVPALFIAASALIIMGFRLDATGHARLRAQIDARAAKASRKAEMEFPQEATSRLPPPRDCSVREPHAGHHDDVVRPKGSPASLRQRGMSAKGAPCRFQRNQLGADLTQPYRYHSGIPVGTYFFPDAIRPKLSALATENQNCDQRPI